MRLLFTGVFLLFSFCCLGQNITNAEYFFNTDPGTGNGLTLAVNSNTGQLTQTFSIPTTGLADGFHSFYIRTYNSDNNWSLYDKQSFYLKNFTSSNIASAEYFFNTDPGIGNGISQTVNNNSGTLSQTFTIPTASLSEGFNNIYIRTFNSENNWSLYDRQSFYLKSFNTYNIASAEYFFNSDPGVGNGISLNVNSNSGQLTQVFSIPTTSLLEGFHSFYVRTQNNDGDWSLYDRHIIYIKDFDLSPDEVSAAEYFIDNDPGIGNGVSIVFGDASQSTQVLNINSTGLADGDHLFYVRVQDSNGDWSIYDKSLFNIDSSLGIEDSLFKSIRIYPSPFDNEISIKLPQGGQIIKTQIYNNLGQTIYSNTQNKSTLELSNLKSGIYILNLETNIGKASYKIIKK